MRERILKRIWYSFIALVGLLLILSSIGGAIWGISELHVHYKEQVSLVVLIGAVSVFIGSPVAFGYFVYIIGIDIQEWWESR